MFCTSEVYDCIFLYFRTLYVIKTVRRITRKITRAINRVSEHISSNLKNAKRFEKELSDLKADYQDICLLHGELYEYTPTTEHKKLDEWETELIEEIHKIEEKVEQYLLDLKEDSSSSSQNSDSGEFAENERVSLRAKGSTGNKSKSPKARGDSERKSDRSDVDDIPFDQWIADLVEFQETAIPDTNDTLTLAQALFRLEASRDIPTVELAKFNGDPMKYVDFISKFKIHVHDKRHLTDNMRMTQLTQHLSGDAARALSGFGTDGKVYASALKQLKSDFGRKSTVARTHISKLSEGPRITHRNALKDLSLDLVTTIATLKRLNYYSDANSNAVLRKIVARLPGSLIDRWKLVASDIREKDNDPTIFDLSEFVRRRVRAEFDPDFGDLEKFKDNKYTASSDKRRPVNSQQRVRFCGICNGQHDVSECPTFLNYSVPERIENVKLKRLCFSCLLRGHITRVCRSKKICGQYGCTRTHHPLIHVDPPAASSASVLDQECMLPVIRVTFIASNGRRRQGNVLVDGGAGTTIIPKDFAKALGLQGKREHLNITVVGGDVLENPMTRRVKFQIAPISGGEYFNVEAYELERTVSDIPPLDRKWLRTFNHLQDLSFPHEAGPIDLILGVQYSHLHSEDQIREGCPYEPVAKRTKLGWYVLGADHCRRTSPICGVNSVERINLDKMYDFETLGIQAPNCACPREVMSSEDRKAMNLLEASCERIDNRYQIGLPWKRSPEELPNNYPLAEKRLCSLERSLLKDEGKAKMYNEAVHEYVKNGWAERLTGSEDIDSSPAYYLPHHGVFRPDKPSTPLRVVFDPASEYERVSLNSFLYKGPSLIGSLYGVLLRFREDTVAIVGDIAKMYLQILLPERDTYVHRFLWRDLDQSRIPDVYRLLRVTFGDKPSPDMASYVMLRMADENQNSFPKGAIVLQRDRYMDDLIHSCSSKEDAVSTMDQVDSILATGSFKIKQWYVTGHRLEEEQGGDCTGEIPEAAESEIEMFHLNGEEEEIKTLGIRWTPVSDTLKFVVKESELETFTKRKVLSKLSMLYDPLGLAAAVTITARIALQDLWRKKNLGWDDQMPENMRTVWQKLFRNISRLSEIEFPRCVRPEGFVDGSELHVFVDASVRAYGAVAYLMWKTGATAEIRLVSAKARVAPLHQTTIPRLELMASLVGSRLAKSIMEEFKEKPVRVTLWTDSQIVLHWLSAESITLKQFVGVRVAEIQATWSSDNWRFVPTQLNPADDISRGISVEEMNGRWTQGPDFLRLPPDEWPSKQSETRIETADLEVKKSKMMNVFTCFTPIMNSGNVSSWQRLVRVTAYCLRFINRLRGRLKQVDSEDGKRETLQRDELNAAEIYWIRCAQQTMNNWEKDLVSLAPFEEQGIIRVGGRLRHVGIEYDVSHPILLPAKHPVSRLIMTDIHRKLCHVGPERTLCECRRRYWILRGRNLAKGVVRDCVICRKLRQPPHSTLMADLPPERMRAFAPPFTVTGIDLFGPFQLKYGRNKAVKAWGAIFTCGTVRALHLEIVADLSTQAFIQSLRRFAAHHGWPETIISDNGTSFVGANRELRTLVQNGRKCLEDFAMLHKVRWRFITPHSPHQGGLYESLIKQVKQVLKVVVGHHLLTWNEMSTVFAEVECLLNSRPLSYMSNDPNDIRPVTPNHFLLGRATNEIPQGPFQETKNLHKRFEFVQSLVQQTWKRFLREYIPTMMSRAKWQHKGRQLQIGDVVLLTDFNSPRGKWHLGRVIEVYPGKDGIVRNIKVRTKNGEYQRSVQKCCLLLKSEVESSKQSDQQ